jgi:plasmid stabilization system protein ParE
MKIRYAESFERKLKIQIGYIAADKPAAARKFKKDLYQRVNAVASHPLKSKKSIWSHDPNTRDLIFKGYTLIYKIDWDKEEILVFGFLKDQETPDLK